MQVPPIGVALLLFAIATLGAFAVNPRWRWAVHLPHPRIATSGGLTPEQARAINAKIPFVPGPVIPARRFVFHGTPAGKLQAIDCLATAAIYEAGDDELDQRAVMQVVINRVRRSGFPKTVCGVVYDGSERETGCQFSFTCDGSVDRRPETQGWADARLRARQALSGYVFAAIGTATHYHADWIVPYWSSSLAKVAKVHSHIFYRHWGPKERQLNS
jgi:hypothetical protein